MASEDITEQKRIEAAEREQRQLVEAMYQIGINLLTTVELPDVLDNVLKQVKYVVPYDSANIMLLEGDLARVVRSRNENHREYEEAALSLEISIAKTPILETMTQTGEPLIIGNTPLDERWRRLIPSEQILSYVGVPIQFERDVIGFLNLNSEQPYFFGDEHVKRLTLFAAQAALAIQNAQLHTKARTLAVMQERQWLARELHDSVTQTLFASSVLAEALPRLFSNDKRLAEMLDQLRILNQSALAEMRMLLAELRPTHLLKMSLPNYLDQLVQALRGRTKTQFDLKTEAQFPIPVDIQIAFYRIAQEALNNIIKHSHATEAILTYTSSSEQTELCITDNGDGFDPKQAKQGLGLETMQERARMIGASLSVNSERDKGTEVRIFWVPARNRPH